MEIFMKIRRIEPNFIYNKHCCLQSKLAFQSGSEVVDDGDYVKIPKKKYKRDKILENILTAILLIDLFWTIFKNKGKPPEFP